ncbi:hypothetical protein AAF143_01235 [Cyanobium sp. ATX-6F1]
MAQRPTGAGRQGGWSVATAASPRGADPLGPGGSGSQWAQSRAAGGLALARALGRRRLDTAALSARALLALEWAAAHALAPERVRREAEGRLLLPEAPVPFEGELWRATGLASDGALELALGPRRAQLRRCF